MLRTIKGGGIAVRALARRNLHPTSALGQKMLVRTRRPAGATILQASAARCSSLLLEQQRCFSTRRTSNRASRAVRFSSLALEPESDSDEDDEFGEFTGDERQRCDDKNRSNDRTKDRHCETCTCEDESAETTSIPEGIVRDTNAELQQLPNKNSNDNVDTEQASIMLPCGAVKTEYDPTPFPPPLPEPKYSVRRRVLSAETTTALQSATGQQMLIDSLQQGTAASYISLTQQFLNQADPAYCGLTTACMVLNALEQDCTFRWKGGWRYFANEDVLLAHCSGCWSRERLLRAGISADEFQRLVTCHGLDCTLKRPAAVVEADEDADADTTNPPPRAADKVEEGHTLEEFRSDVQQILSSHNHTSGGGGNNNNSVLVVSFARSALGQTGEGHFSPVAAFHAEADAVLVLDVARFKYPPYWVSVPDLYHAMQPRDEATGKPRGWFRLRSRNKTADGSSAKTTEQQQLGENRRPAHLVPVAGRDPHPCPMHEVQVHFCPNQSDSSRRT